MTSTATSERERLEAADFDLAAGDVFDPVNWLNKRLSRSAVTYDRLDQHLSSLGTACQLLCQKTSDEIEVAANHLVTQLPSTSRHLERIQQETLRGHSQLGKILDGLKDADERKSTGLQGLAEVDAVKARVETACSALREIGSWDRKVRDCDQMTHAGNLPAALSQLASLKDVLEAFKMLPEYPKKEEQLKQLEDNLVNAARRKTKMAIDQNSVSELKACSEVFACAGRHNEPCAIADSVFYELANKAFQSKGLRPDAPATEIAAGVMAVFEALQKSIKDRWQMLETINTSQASSPSEVIARTVSTPSNSSSAMISGAVISVARSALSILTKELESRLPKVAPGIQAALPADSERETGAFALLAAYVDGLKMLQECTPMQVPGMWLEFCRQKDTGVSVLPWPLLREVAVFVVWQPMQDTAVALVPPITSNMSPSEAVLAAESNAKRLLQMPSAWAKRLESHGAAQLAVVWLACIDITLATFWGRWDKLIETFQNTLQGKLKGGQADSAFDASLLNECMQLHSMLHDSLAKHFQEFQREVIHHVARMDSAIDSAFGRAVAEIMQDPKWCESLAVPSVAALQSAKSSLEGIGPESSSLGARTINVLPAATAALAESEKQVRSLVTRCCVQPVQVILSSYTESPEWNKQVDNSDSFMGSGLNPLPFITAVGEHLFALVPQLESSQDSSQLSWLPTILEAVLQESLQKALQIKTLSVVGSQQLLADMEYLQKVTEALGSGSASATTIADGTAGGAAAEVREFVEALTHFSRQQARFYSCAAKGQPFSEEIREGSALNKRFERSLRAAMGLP